MDPIDIAARDYADELAKQDTPCSNRSTQMALISAAGLIRSKGMSLREALTITLLEPLEGAIHSRAAEIANRADG